MTLYMQFIVEREDLATTVELNNTKFWLFTLVAIKTTTSIFK